MLLFLCLTTLHKIKVNRNIKHRQNVGVFSYAKKERGIEVKYPGLQKAMKENNESCRTLCDLLALPKCSISWRMNKKTDFRISEIDKIMKHYNKTYEELFR